ncbi:type II secretion system F family protein [Falsibacillus pallidus]|uniref:Type IV pilus assembly protein PilC n=1 Tax=Falsibacillus pallidus TaxID=493781 RepID=A0A370GK56_9BACI|nr:type II secretion system F family protein [Falsibacillus pallidus]RDI44158.1 type IV pilus assembly protein PilC [Falsibacillus pallidus]
MPVFQYRGRDRRGSIVKGKISAINHREAVGNLKERGISIRNIEELKGIFYKEIKFGLDKVKFKHLVIYIRQFSTLIKAGITIVDATKILAQQTDNKQLRRVLFEMEEDIRSGMSFSEAAEKHKSIFPPIFINMMKAGEAGGQMEEILDRLAVYFEKQNAIRQKVRAAMTYPAILGGISIGVVIFMLTVILPRFASMFSSFGSKLPPLTAFLLNLSDFFHTFWWVGLLLLILAGTGFYYFKNKTNNGTYWVDYVILRIPIFGKIMQKAILARLTRTLSSLFSATVPIMQSLTIVQKAVGNEVISRVLHESKMSLEKGKSIAEPMQDHWAFPVFVSRMISIGEQSGTLDYMLDKVADFYEAEVDQATEQLKSLLEPVLIVFLAAVVGTIVAAIAIPMFDIFNHIQ